MRLVSSSFPRFWERQKWDQLRFIFSGDIAYVAHDGERTVEKLTNFALRHTILQEPVTPPPPAASFEDDDDDDDRHFGSLLEFVVSNFENLKIFDNFLNICVFREELGKYNDDGERMTTPPPRTSSPTGHNTIM